MNKHHRIAALLRFAVALALFAHAAAAPAQGGYPTKPIRMINPFAAGGTGEILLRVISPTLEARLGQKIVLEGRIGAGGNIGAEATAAAAPDGYTLMLGITNIFTVNPFLYARKDFDPFKALAPVTIAADAPTVFYAHPSLPAANFRELVAYARANPGKVNWASAGNGTSGHLALELLAQRTDVRIVHIPYKGLPPAMNAVLANDAQIYPAGLGAGHGHIKAGKLKAIAVGTNERLALIPDVPTAIEVGFPDYLATTRFMVAAPAGTPPAILERWWSELRHAMSQPEHRKRLDELALVPVADSPAETLATMRREAQLWEQVIRRGNIRAE